MNLTSGSVFKNMIRFSLPYLLSYFLQTLYGMADLFIIGQFNGVAATTAVSIGSQVMHMLTVMIVGLAMGSTVMIGQAVGSGDRAKANRAIGNTVSLFLVVSAVCTLVLLLAVRPITAIMSTPAEAVAGTVSYLTICFAGIPLITAYNIISSIFRGMGDSKSPMYFIAAACAANIALDYLFIGALRLGPAGAALGTTLAQTVSVMIALLAIRRRHMIPGIGKKDFRPRRPVIAELLKIGVPISLQDGFIQISFIVITIFANRRGLADAAAVGVVEKLIGILFLVPSSMSSAVSALSAQNIGAGKHDRVRQTLRYALMLTTGIGICSVLLMLFGAEHAVALFVDDAAAIRLGGQYMRGYVWDCIFAGVHFCFSGYFCAYGRSEISFIHNLLSIVCARIPLAYLAATYVTGSLFPMGLAAPAGSLLSILICIGFYLWFQKQQNDMKHG